MKIYLAGLFTNHCYEEGINTNVLESFFYKEPKFEEYIPKCKDFILDSGAFSFMSGKTAPDYLSYTDRYIEFINNNHIEKFFELDIDLITGLDYVEMLRKRIESRVGRFTIPVWHRSRGIDYFKGLCKDYDYIAIGGIVSKEIKPKEYPWLVRLVDYAHSHNCKIHGLGFTNMKWLSKIHWDSVDSTNWVLGGKFGTVYYFNQSEGRIDSYRPSKGQRAKKYTVINPHNLNEWKKFQKWAEYNL